MCLKIHIYRDYTSVRVIKGSIILRCSYIYRDYTSVRVIKVSII